MALERELVDWVRELDEHDLRQLQLLIGAHLDRQSDLPGDEKVSLRSQMIRCGKPECNRCPHGPYWYAYWRVEGKRRSKYLGRLIEEA
ncbi:MAG: hypothetical protein GEU79_04485 [Acidimicrobiia bacterium]|nr:hypothetical protein [Acidimicrobiia bacterium]